MQAMRETTTEGEKADSSLLVNTEVRHNLISQLDI